MKKNNFVGLKYWSTDADKNADNDPEINWQEGQMPSTVNNSARMMMARLKENDEVIQNRLDNIDPNNHTSLYISTVNANYTNYTLHTQGEKKLYTIFYEIQIEDIQRLKLSSYIYFNGNDEKSDELAQIAMSGDEFFNVALTIKTPKETVVKYLKWHMIVGGDLLTKTPTDLYFSEDHTLEFQDYLLFINKSWSFRFIEEHPITKDIEIDIQKIYDNPKALASPLYYGEMYAGPIHVGSSLWTVQWLSKRMFRFNLSTIIRRDSHVLIGGFGIPFCYPATLVRYEFGFYCINQSSSIPSYHVLELVSSNAADASSIKNGYSDRIIAYPRIEDVNVEADASIISSEWFINLDVLEKHGSAEYKQYIHKKIPFSIYTRQNLRDNIFPPFDSRNKIYDSSFLELK